MRKGFNFTKEHIEYVKQITQGRKNKEIVEMFNKKFGTNLTNLQIVGLKNRQGIKGSLDDRDRPVAPVKKVVKENGIPKYVYRSLERYGNTIITKRDVKRLGGEDGVLKMLKQNGFDCTLEEPTEQVAYYEGKRKVTLDHFVLRGRKSEKRNESVVARDV
jgi:hypothetical protein